MATNFSNLFMRHRRAGVCLHLTSLPGNYGIGEIGDVAFRFIDTMSDMNLSVWQFLPIGPTGFGNSPYQSLSTFAGNEMLIDVGGLVKTGLLARKELAPLTGLPSATVDFEQLIPKKSALIRLAAKRFSERANAELKSGFDRFQDRHNSGWLHDYALFRVLKSRHGEDEWLRWPARYRSRDVKAIQRLERDEAGLLRLVKIEQFLFYHQWRELQQYAHERGILLFGDLPIYVALDSADAWASPELLRLDKNGRPELLAGVPPDYFSEDGQLWGNPVYDWTAHAAENYRWWISRLRHSMQVADLVRIDHFRGFESFFAIGQNALTARAGEWHKGPGDALFTALRKSLGDISIVAEDLGVITPEVENLRSRHNIPGMKVLQFEVLRNDFNITGISENCVCYTGTHDNDTTVGWYRANPGGAVITQEISKTRKMIRDACRGRAASIHLDMVRLAFGSAAQMAIAPLQDYLGLGSEARLNTPGTTESNWRWRVEFEQIDAALAESVAGMVDESNRNTFS